MALFTHAGLGTADLAQNAIRIDLTDFLAASLIPENNFLGNLTVGPEWSGQSLNYPEDRLNQNFVTSINSMNSTDSPVTITVAAADGAILEVGYILADTTASGIITGEQLQILTISQGSPNYTMTASRAYGGTTAVTHAGSAVLKVVGTPTYQNSPLGRDLSRARLLKTNERYSVEMNVNIAQEVLQIAKDGYSPGVDDELFYQFNQRVTERMRDVNNALLFGRTSNGVVTSALQNDYSTNAGVTAFLDGTFNTTAAPVNYNGQTLTDQVINDLNKNIERQGGRADWLMVGVNGVDITARIYNDRIRIEQSDETRGFKVKYIDTTAQNQLRILYDQAIPDTSPNGVVYLLDSGRMALRPFSNSLFYTIAAATLSDGDALRAMMKFSFEMRNTGTDVGYAHQMAYGLTLS